MEISSRRIAVPKLVDLEHDCSASADLILESCDSSWPRTNPTFARLNLQCL